MHLVAVFVRAVNTLLVTKPRAGLAEVNFPRDGVTYRGGGLPDEHKDFFMAGKSFRVAGFLASSFSKNVALNFMCTADMERNEPCVLWEIHVDPEGARIPTRRCCHVNYVERTLVNYPEEEYLFAPYSPFTVESVSMCTFVCM